MGKRRKALALISDLHDLYPDESELTNFYAELLIDIDEEEKALEVLETISPEDPSYAESLLLMADLYQMQGLFEVSEQKLLQAKSMLQDEPVIDFALGNYTSLRDHMQKPFLTMKRRQKNGTKSAA